MKTLASIFAHAGIGALQAIAGTQFLNPNSPSGALGNTGIQLGVQTGLMVLQGILAVKNSKTDPNGKPLVEVSPEKFVTNTTPDAK